MSVLNILVSSAFAVSLLVGKCQIPPPPPIDIINHYNVSLRDYIATALIVKVIEEKGELSKEDVEASYKYADFIISIKKEIK
jgi:hypothetical protein